MAIFWSKVEIFGLSPILGAPYAKKQIVGTHRSRKHNLQHPYAPKYAIFHENRPKRAVSLSNIDFLALYNQLKDPPPYFEGAGCKKSKLWSHKDHDNTFCSIRMHHNLPFLMENTAKKKFIGQKIIFFALRQAVEDCPPILRVLDTNKQIVGTHGTRKHNLQHPYAPKFAVFHEKNGHKWPFSGHILIFFGFVQAVEGFPSLF